MQSTEEEESRRTKRESAASLCIKHVPRGGRETKGTKKQGLEEEAREVGKKREREGESERTPTRLGGYVRIIILRYSHIYKSAI